MQNLLSLWSAMTPRRRAIVAGATLAMFAAVLGLSRMAGAPQPTLLYAGLEGAAAGEVVAALDQRGIAYEVRGDSIYVPEAQRDALRMALAAEGLPAAGPQGYELLDGLSGFGTTSQMFDAAYLRAKEGELARTVLSNPQIRTARVHIAQAPGQPFRAEARATASVTVTTVAGGLAAPQARALRHLVAAAVTGMRPEDVAVIDAAGGLIEDDDGTALAGGSAEGRAAMLRRNVERLLAARVGPGRAVVEVSVDVVTESEQITERTFDPKGRVAIATDTEEKTGSSTDPAEGAVTVASNLPDGQAAPPGAAGQSQSSETRERVNFEVSETKRELVRAPGGLRRITVAVLVDGLPVTGADGAVTVEPRPEAELAVLRDLVASAVGLDESRGDVLTLRSLAFGTIPAEGTLAEAGMMAGVGAADVLRVAQFAALALVALVLGLFVVRPVLLRPALPAPAAPLALAGFGGAAAPALTGVIDDEGDRTGLPVVSRDEPRAEADAMARLRRLIAERQTESVEILRGWMERDEERA